MWWIPAGLASEPGIEAYARVLRASVVEEGRVDYTEVAAHRADLDAARAAFAAAPTASAGVWIDAYNAETLAVVLDGGLPASIRDLDGGRVWTTHRVVVAGASPTLDALEGRLRALGDPRIHAALVCAARSCPPLAATPYAAAPLDAALDAAARRWVATTAATVTPERVELSPIFQWYAQDFAAPGETPEAAAVRFLARYAAGERGAWLRAGPREVRWGTYDWSLNRR